MAPPPVDPRRASNVAIIGAGISGLVVAYLLGHDHQVTVFEAGDHVGGHTNTVQVDLDGRDYAVDTGFIVYNDLNYPNFARLLGRLGVATRPTSMSFSVRCDRTGLEYNGTSLNRLFAQRRNLVNRRFLGMIRDILRFHREAPGLLEEDAPDEAVTVGEFLERRGYGEAFAEQYLVPMGAAIWSCPPRTFHRFPVRFVIEFMRNHRMLGVGGRPQWRVVHGGSCRYVEVLTRPLADRIRVSTPIRSVQRSARGVRLVTAAGDESWFDHVVIACHADQALAILEDPSETERNLLGAFPYQANEAVLHTDTSVLPRSRRAWASWNYHRRRDDPEAVTVTYNMSMLQGLPGPHVFGVTLNGASSIDPERILRRFTYHHPVYTETGRTAQGRHEELINANRTSYCGAYWGYGFHEDGVNSALTVARAFGQALL